MGAVGGLLGTSGGVNGTGISGPQGTQVDIGVDTKQADVANRQAMQGLQQQKDLMNALRGQGGFQKQTDQYNQGQELLDQLQAANGVGTQNEAIANQRALMGQQQGLAQQYQNIANGTGPNPAQAMLNQATGANVANQAALMAGQRGAGANVGLMARQAAQQGAATQQQAVGQGAVMQANQSLNALQGLGAAQQAIGNTNMNMSGIGGQQLAAQQTQQGALTGQAANMIGQQMAGTNAYNQAVQSEQNSLLGALNAQNQARIGMQGNVNSANAGLAGATMQGQQGMIGGLMNGAGGAAATGSAPPGSDKAGMLAGAAHGGEIHKMAIGGDMSSSFGQFLSGFNAGTPVQAGSYDMGVAQIPSSNPGADKLKEGFSSAAGKAGKFLASKGPAEAPSGGGSASVPRAQAEMFSDGGLASQGGHVKAEDSSEKAVESGDSYGNDKIPAMLSEHEIVLPRSVTMSDDPVKAAAEFVAKTIAERGGKSVEKFADGGESKKEEKELADDIATEDLAASPAPVPQPTLAQQPAAPAPAPAPVQAQPQAAPQPVSAPVQAAPEAQQPAAQAQGSGITPDEKMAEHMNFATDMAAGKIAPATYGSLFAKRDTLGKIGTLFGLLVSGAGSGLAHQSNMVMDMMNKELERDLEAQKQNVHNAQSFLSMQYNHNIQKAQEAGMRIENLNKATEGTAKAAGYASAIEDSEMQKSPFFKTYVDQMHLIQKAYSIPEAENKMLEATYHDLSRKAAGNPVAQDVLKKVMRPIMNAKVQQNIAKGDAAAKMAVEKSANESAINDKVLMDANRRAQQQEATWRNTGISGKYRPDSIPKDDLLKIQDEKAFVNANRNAMKDYAEAFKELYGMPMAGQAPGLSSGSIGAAVGSAAALIPGVGPALASLVGATGAAGSGIAKDTFQRSREAKIANLAKRMNVSEDDLEKMLPAWNSSAQDVASAFKSGIEHFKHSESGHTPTIDLYKKSIPTLYRDLSAPDYKNTEDARQQLLKWTKEGAKRKGKQ